eukprot:scaffold274155_cov24-Tisochrysis_lutea.AAC.3
MGAGRVWDVGGVGDKQAEAKSASFCLRSRSRSSSSAASDARALTSSASLASSTSIARVACSLVRMALANSVWYSSSFAAIAALAISCAD